MSSALAIAAITAVLKDLLNDGLLNHDLSVVGNVHVSATPPDRITTGQNEPNQLNLFLYQVTPNLGWRNADLPSRDTTGTRLTNQPLALDLHYMLSSYGTDDLNSELLFGYALQILHEHPVITRDQLRTSLGAPALVNTSILPPAFQNQSATDLADQVELIKISPVFLSTEELSKLWTAMQARYRPTMAYVVSVVLIQSTAPTKVAPPVLKRGPNDSGPSSIVAMPPALYSVRPAVNALLPALRLGDDVAVTGAGLDLGTVQAIFNDSAANLNQSLAPLAGGTADALTLHIPSVAEDINALNRWAIGLYNVSLQLSVPNVPAWSTNSVPVALAPTIVISPQSAAPGTINLTVVCTPRLLPEQESQALLLFGSKSVTPQTVTTPADPTKATTLTFTLSAVAKGEYLVRLRVQGVDSLPILFQGTPPKPVFDPTQKVTVA